MAGCEFFDRGLCKFRAGEALVPRIDCNYPGSTEKDCPVALGQPTFTVDPAVVGGIESSPQAIATEIMRKKFPAYKK